MSNTSGSGATSTKKVIKKPVVKQSVVKTPANQSTDDYRVTRSVINDIRARRPKNLTGSSAKVWMMEELEPYMGSVERPGLLFPGLVSNKAPTSYGYYGGDGGDGRVGGGGGGIPMPPPPPGFKVRTTSGNRLTPYWESEPDFIQGWQPRLTVLGNTQAW